MRNSVRISSFIALTAALCLFIEAINGQTLSACECIDQPPSGGVSCEEQARFGKCGRDWMEGFCQRSCGTCNCGEVPAAEGRPSPDVVPVTPVDNVPTTQPCPSCVDTPPNDEFTCAQQKEFDQCTEDWMEGFCQVTCGTCDCGAPSQPIALPVPDQANPIPGPMEVGGSDQPVDLPLSNSNPTDSGPREVVFIEPDEPNVDKPQKTKSPKKKASKKCSDSGFAKVAASNGLTILSTALDAASLGGVLDDARNEYTLFAPVDQAFDDLGTRLGVSTNEVIGLDFTPDVLKYHIIPDILTMSELSQARILKTIEGTEVFATKKSQIEAIGSTASIFGEAIPVCNSMIYTIDTVLLPFDDPAQFLGTSRNAARQKPPKNSRKSKKDKCDPNGDLTLTLSENPNFSTLVLALETAGLLDLLSDKRSKFTVFAPDNDAFDAALTRLGITLEDLLGNKPELTKILEHHVSKGNLDSKSLVNGALKTIHKTGKIFIDIDESSRSIDISDASSKARVTSTDVDNACNGAVHQIDSVLIPIASDQLVTGAAASSKPVLQSAERGDPNPKKRQRGRGCRTVSEVFSQTGRLKLLHQAAIASGLEADISNPSLNITFFAPTDNAFKKLRDWSKKEIMAALEEPELVTPIFSYHAVDRPLSLQKLMDGKKMKTLVSDLEGNPLRLTVRKAAEAPLGVMIEGVTGVANIIENDIKACNSIVHIIDSVLLPIDDGGAAEDRKPNKKKPRS